MKRAAVVALLAAACSSSSKPEPDQQRPAPPAPPTEPTNVVGKLVGGTERTDAFVRTHYAGKRVPLRDLPVAEYLGGLPMTGDADITIDITVPVSAGRPDYRKATGMIDVGCPTGCAIGDGTTRLQIAPKNPRAAAFAGDGIEFGHIAIDRARARMTFADGRAKIIEWTFESKDLSLDIASTIDLAEDMTKSEIDACLAFRPEEALLKREPRTHAALSVTGASLGSDGRFHIKLSGRLGEMKRLAQDCAITH